MAYKQGGNPLSRKSSPLNAANPFKRVSPLSMKAEDGTPHRKMDDETKAKHKAEMHNKGGDPEQDEVMREEDMGQQANQPLGPERRSSQSPLNKHDEWQSKIDAARAKWEKEKPEGDFYEVHADLFKKQEEAKKAHKEEGSSSPANVLVDAKGITDTVKEATKGERTAADRGHVDKASREGSKKDERKKRRKERKAIRKDKTLSRSQKTMAKKESRDKQKENIKNK